MALIKPLSWKGYNPEYWFITEISPNMRTKQTTIGLALYKDKKTREIDKSKKIDDWSGIIGRQNYPHQIHTVVVEGVGLTLPEYYKLIKINKDNTFFHDAIDDI